MKYNFLKQEVETLVLEPLQNGLDLKERICSPNGLDLKERICLSKFFREQILSFLPNEKKGKFFHVGVVSLGVVSISFKDIYMYALMLTLMGYGYATGFGASCCCCFIFFFLKHATDIQLSGEVKITFKLGVL